MQTITRAAAVLLAGASAFAQGPVVRRSMIWVDTVKRSDMPVMVRGQGVLGADRTAELKIPESMIAGVQLGQAASIDTRQGVAGGKVSRIGADVVNGEVPVGVEITGALPAAARAGMAVDGTIQITMLNDVVHVGRPVQGRAESADTIFKIDPDGQYATRVKVQYGRASVNVVEIRGGLAVGDRVILSDMSAYQGVDRVRLE